MSGIVQYLQIIQQNTHFISLKISLPTHGIGRYSLFPENGRKDFCPAPDAPCQDHDIPVLYSAVFPGLLVQHHAVTDQLTDAARDHPRLCPPLVLASGILLVKKKEFTPAEVFLSRRKRRKFRSRIECGTIVIFDAAQLFLHDLAEDIVYTVKDFHTAAEVLVQIDPLHHAIFHTVSIIFLHEKFRSGQAETVNALLYIAYHENIIFSPGYSRNTGQDRLLNQIAVLILIDHYLIKPFLIFSGNDGWYKYSVFFFCQNSKSKLLHIIEVDHIPETFLLIQHVRKAFHKLCQRNYRRQGILHVLLPHLTGSIEIIFLHPL